MKLSSRAREALKRFLLLVSAALGIISGGSALLPFVEWRFWIYISILAIGISALWTYYTTRLLQFPEEVILDVDTTDGQVFLEAPTPYHMLKAANHHARQLYGHDALTFGEIERWWQQNPFVEAVLRSESGDYLGYFDILPLTKEGAGLIESGSVEERQIKPEHILEPREMKNADTIYLAGIAVKDAGTELGKCRTAKLFCGLVSYTRFYYGDSPRRILALAATANGERLLKGIGARIVCVHQARKDCHDLYEISLTPDLLSKVESRARQRGEIAKAILRPID